MTVDPAMIGSSVNAMFRRKVDRTGRGGSARLHCAYAVDVGVPVATAVSGTRSSLSFPILTMPRLRLRAGTGRS